MLKYGQEHVEKVMQHYHERYRDQQIDLLKKRPNWVFSLSKPQPLDTQVGMEFRESDP
jgi:hypothetical protein